MTMQTEPSAQDRNVLGIIPARAGSKGVVGKNLRHVAGLPLIGHAIRTAKESRRLNHFLVTTDGDDIAAAAHQLDSPVVQRPARLAEDDTPMPPVLQHAIEWAEAHHGVTYDGLVLLQPTAPIRTGDDVDAVIEQLFEDDVDSVISVCPVEDEHPARMYELDSAGRMQPLWPDLEMSQRQDLPALYHRNGALYAARRDLLMDHGTLVGPRRRAYVMDRKLLVNVDDERDLMIAEAVVGRWLRGEL